FDMFVAIAREPHTNLVLGVERKCVVNDQAAARTKWEIVKMLLLRQIGRKRDRVAARGTYGAAECEPADLARGRNITLQQCRREIAHRHVVETVAGLASGQQRG